jgi:hypothetical protein
MGVQPGEHIEAEIDGERFIWPVYKDAWEAPTLFGLSLTTTERNIVSEVSPA